MPSPSTAPTSIIRSESPAAIPHVTRGMPAVLTMVRHGLSLANVIQSAMKKELITDYPPGFKETPDREMPLAVRGEKQTEPTGAWLKAQYPAGFDVYYVADHLRARQTAGLTCKAAGWDTVEIRIDPLLGERNWGRFAEFGKVERDSMLNARKRDPLHSPMPDGETMLETRNRTRALLERCTREFSGKKVLVFSHGEFIEALWAEIAHFHTESQLEFFHSPAGNIRNCQIVEFASIAPGSTEYTGKLQWVRSSCPQADVFGEWAEIPRVRFTPQELLDQVARHPKLPFSDFSIPRSLLQK